MRIPLLLFAFCCFYFADARLLGTKRCTWGPSYWCSNLTSSAECRATKHCIQTVWQHKEYPEDSDSVCQTCLDMVKQARDQLESNETMEEIKEVFEGSCKLIPIKVVSQECCKLADDFIPELVDTLASQMNPQVVCSVAGLCNNAKIDKLLEEADQEKTEVDENSDTCAGCYKVMNIAEGKFNALSSDQFLHYLLNVCGRMGSLSDGCSDIVVSYFPEIYRTMKNGFNARNICLMSGECAANFHVHDVEISPKSNVGYVKVGDDNLPCELCEQLVGHLRDLLVADTTEAEFKKVLIGLCGQYGKFKDQCLSIVNEYYTQIYKFLVSELNSTQLCEMIDICPGPGLQDVPIAPLLPEKTLKVIGMSPEQKPKTDEFELQTAEMMQLPIERFHHPANHVYNKQLCAFCEYFLHYVQQAITDPKAEKQIKKAVDEACQYLPSSVETECEDFVNNYGEAFVAILAQEIDPSVVCPMLQICPGSKSTDIEIFMQANSKDEPNCPLCLFAVTKLQEMIKGQKSKETIENALNTLCSHFNGNIALECHDFVHSYTNELIEMLMDDFKAQEICVYLRICKDKTPAPSITDYRIGGVINTNEIPDFTANGRVLKPNHNVGDKAECVICEFVMARLEELLKDKDTEEEIKHTIKSICNALPGTVSKECNQFVDKYANIVFALITSKVPPKEICGAINLCQIKVAAEPVKGPLCPLCKIVMQQIETMLNGSVSEAEVKAAIEKVCYVLPREQSAECNQFIEQNGHRIYEMLVMLTEPSTICSFLLVCEDKNVQAIKIEINKCAVCEAAVMAIDRILANPKVDHSIEHVLEKACRALPRKNMTRCIQLIDLYGDQLFSLVSHITDSRMVCKEIGECPGASMARLQLL